MAANWVVGVYCGVVDDGYIATSLYVKTMDGTVDCERVGKPYSQS